MEEETFENADSQNGEVIAPESEVGLPADPIEIEPKDEELEEAETLKQRNQELYEQLKKAKGFVRDKTGKWVKKETLQVPKQEPKETAGITNEELFALVKAQVADEDMAETKIYARSHGITINEALKTPELKALLKVRAEYRKTAETANTGSSRYGSAKITDDQLVSNAEKGQFPDSDDEIKRLFKLRKGIK